MPSLVAPAAILDFADKARHRILPDGIAHAIPPDRPVVLLAISPHLQYRGDLVAAHEAGVRLR